MFSLLERSGYRGWGSRVEGLGKHTRPAQLRYEAIVSFTVLFMGIYYNIGWIKLLLHEQ